MFCVAIFDLNQSNIVSPVSYKSSINHLSGREMSFMSIAQMLDEIHARKLIFRCFSIFKVYSV